MGIVWVWRKCGELMLGGVGKEGWGGMGSVEMGCGALWQVWGWGVIRWVGWYGYSEVRWVVSD